MIYNIYNFITIYDTHIHSHSFRSSVPSDFKVVLGFKGGILQHASGPRVQLRVDGQMSILEFDVDSNGQRSFVLRGMSPGLHKLYFGLTGVPLRPCLCSTFFPSFLLSFLPSFPTPLLPCVCFFRPSVFPSLLISLASFLPYMTSLLSS